MSRSFSVLNLSENFYRFVLSIAVVLQLEELLSAKVLDSLPVSFLN